MASPSRGQLATRIALNKDMRRFEKLATALGEPLENVSNMQETERSQLMIAMGINDARNESVDEDEGDIYPPQNDNQEPSKPGSKRKRKSSNFLDEDEDFVPSDSNDLFDKVRNMVPREQSNPRKRRASKQKDEDDDADFVDVKSNNFSQQIENLSKDFLVDVPGPSTSAYGTGRSSRLAAKKANLKLTKSQIAECLESSQDSQDDFVVNNHSFPIVDKKTEIVEPIKSKKNNDNKEPNQEIVQNNQDQEAVKLVSSVNSKLKEPFLINHIQSPQEILNMDLPVFDVNLLQKLKESRPSISQDNNDELIVKNVLFLNNLTSQGLVHANYRSPDNLPWQKLMTTRAKLIKVKFNKDEDAQEVDGGDVIDQDKVPLPDDNQESISDQQNGENKDHFDNKDARKSDYFIKLGQRNAPKFQPKAGSLAEAIVGERSQYVIPKLRKPATDTFKDLAKPEETRSRLKLPQKKQRSTSGDLRIDTFFDKAEVSKQNEDDSKKLNAIINDKLKVLENKHSLGKLSLKGDVEFSFCFIYLHLLPTYRGKGLVLLDF